MTGNQQIDGELTVSGSMIADNLTLLSPQGDISMGSFVAQDPSISYQSDFSTGVDGWIVSGGTVISTDESVLSATDNANCLMHRSGVFNGTTPHRITATTTGSTSITLQSWDATLGVWKTLLVGWNGTDIITVTPFSTTLRFRSNTPTFQVISLTVKEVTS